MPKRKSKDAQGAALSHNQRIFASTGVSVSPQAKTMKRARAKPGQVGLRNLLALCKKLDEERAASAINARDSQSTFNAMEPEDGKYTNASLLDTELDSFARFHEEKSQINSTYLQDAFARAWSKATTFTSKQIFTASSQIQSILIGYGQRYGLSAFRVQYMNVLRALKELDEESLFFQILREYLKTASDTRLEKCLYSWTAFDFRKGCQRLMRLTQEADAKGADERTLVDTSAASITSDYTCSQCKGTTHYYTQAQIRRADEPMTTFLTCVTCKKRFKQ